MAAGAGPPPSPGVSSSPSLVTSSYSPARRPPPREPSSPPPPSAFSAAVTENGVDGGCSCGISSSNGSSAQTTAIIIEPLSSSSSSSSRARGPVSGSTARSSYAYLANKADDNHHASRQWPRRRSPGTGGSLADGGSSSSSKETPATVHPSILQPRVAVVLNVPPFWHPWLFALRLLSCLPAAWWGLPSALHLLLRVLPRPEFAASSALSQPAADGHAEPYALTETALATIWCFACGYLSFFFTDCLMSRWLINYTPQATIVRLLTIGVVNAYITLTTLSLSGGFQDPRLLLPGWIGIATTLTVCYHISHQRINIRKETAASVNVFSIASYLSMVALLAHVLAFQPDYPTMPVLLHARRLWKDILHFVSHVKGTIERERAEL